MSFTAKDWARAFCADYEKRSHTLPNEVVVTAVVEQLAADLRSDPDEDVSNRARLILNLVTDNPAVMAVMGSAQDTCKDLGCQFQVIARQLADAYREGRADGLAHESKLGQVAGVDKRS